MERNYAMDYFKFFAIFSVVVIHTSPFRGLVFWGIDGKYISILITTFARFGVPFFFIISGFLFGQKLLTLTNTTVYFKNYFKKVVKLFIYWSLFFVVYGLGLSVLRALVKGIGVKTEVFNYLSNFVGLKPMINYIFFGTSGAPASFHLWFLAALIWSILIVYIFIKINKLTLLLYISLFLNIIGLFGQTYPGLINFEIFDINIPTRSALFFGLFYMTLGSFCAFNYGRIKQIITKVKSSTLVVLFFIFSLTQIFERAIAEIFWAEEISATDYYLSTIFITICLFLFVIKNGHIGKGSILSKIGKNAVGIYVTHTFFTNLTFLVFGYLGVYLRHYVIFHLLYTPLIFISAYLFYNLLQKVKQKIKMLFNKGEVV